MRQFIAILTLSLLGLPLAADEGMWTFNRLPLERLAADHDFKPSAELLARIMHGSARLNNGGSGSFVSPRGLLLTNRHIASDCIENLSTESANYAADGFYATSRSRELKCPDLEVNALMEIEPVTAQVNKDVTAEMSDAKRLQTQRAAIARIERDCRDSTLLRCDVVSLYEGGVFDLYKYQRYTDVRLVFAPEIDARLLRRPAG